MYQLFLFTNSMNLLYKCFLSRKGYLQRNTLTCQLLLRTTVLSMATPGHWPFYSAKLTVIKQSNTPPQKKSGHQNPCLFLQQKKLISSQQQILPICRSTTGPMYPQQIWNSVDGMDGMETEAVISNFHREGFFGTGFLLMDDLLLYTFEMVFHFRISIQVDFLCIFVQWGSWNLMKPGSRRCSAKIPMCSCNLQGFSLLLQSRWLK